MAWYDNLDLASLSRLLTSYEGGQATGIKNEADATNAANRTGIDATKLNLQAPGMRADAAVQGDVLAGAQDASIQGPTIGTGGKPPTITGGLRPSLLSANTRQLGQGMSRDALLSQMKGPAFTPAPLPAVSGVNTALGAAGLGAGVLGALGKGGSSAGGNIGDLINLFKKPDPYAGITDGADPTHGAGFNPEDPLNADPNIQTLIGQGTAPEPPPQGFPPPPQGYQQDLPNWWDFLPPAETGQDQSNGGMPFGY